MKRTEGILSLLCNVGIIYGTAAIPWEGSDLRTFTENANLLAALGALCMLPFSVACARKGRWKIPRWANALKFIGTCALAVTLLTVLFFLAPRDGYRAQLLGENAFPHLISPILAIVSCAFLEKGEPLSRLHIATGALPVFLYAPVYAVNALFLRKWDDLYGFNAGGKWMVSAAVMLLGTVCLSACLLLIKNRASRGWRREATR
ncbi:MAG: hypothetical protein ACOYI8_01790 [Christensenellales bacterium]